MNRIDKIKHKIHLKLEYCLYYVGFTNKWMWMSISVWMWINKLVKWDYYHLEFNVMNNSNNRFDNQLTRAFAVQVVTVPTQLASFIHSAIVPRSHLAKVLQIFCWSLLPVLGTKLLVAELILIVLLFGRDQGRFCAKISWLVLTMRRVLCSGKSGTKERMFFRW